MLHLGLDQIPAPHPLVESFPVTDKYKHRWSVYGQLGSVQHNTDTEWHGHHRRWCKVLRQIAICWQMMDIYWCIIQKDDGRILTDDGIILTDDGIIQRDDDIILVDNGIILRDYDVILIYDGIIETDAGIIPGRPPPWWSVLLWC